MLKISCHLCNAPTSLRVDNRRNDCYEFSYAAKVVYLLVRASQRIR